jgi:hypothetical protein
MSKQFSFYLTPNDTEGLEKTLRRKLDFLILADSSLRPVPNVLPCLKLKEMGKEDTTVYLVRPSDLDKIVMWQVENSGEWVIDIHFSPAIEFDRCYISRKTITDGRMYYVTGYYNENDVWVEKDKEFLTWAQHLFNISKKSLRLDKNLEAYFGEEALNMKPR